VSAEQARDGAGIVRSAAHAERACAVCGALLGSEPWWVIPGRYPEGEHERCRDWSRYPFPLERQLYEVTKLGARLEGPPAAALARVRRRLSAMRTAWPEGGGGVVREGTLLVAAVKSELSAAGVEAKAIARL